LHITKQMHYFCPTNESRIQPYLKPFFSNKSSIHIMAIIEVKKTACDKVQKTIDRFSKISPLVVYDENTSLSQLTAAHSRLNEAIDARNAAAAAFDKTVIAMNEADDVLTKQTSSFLLLTGNRFGKDSDEYVWAGGTRQSDAIQKAKITRLEKQRAQEELEKKANG
jgi:hypothetical protein